MKRKRVISILLLICTVCGILTGCGAGKEKGTFVPRSWDDLSGRKVAMISGSVFDDLLDEHRDIPDDINYIYTETDIEAALAVLAGEADAMAADMPVAEVLLNTYSGLAIYKETIASDNYGLVLQKDSPLTGRVNTVIAELKANGTVDALIDKWFAPENEEQFIAEPDWPGNNGTLRVALAAPDKPMCYFRNGEPAGYETELVYCIAKALDMKIAWEQVDFDSTIDGVVAGNYDIGLGSFSITKERKQLVDMSDPTYKGAAVLVYNKKATSSAKKEEAGFDPQSWDDFYGRSVAIITGSVFDTLLEEHEEVPDNLTFVYTQTDTDSAASVLNGKADAMVTDLPVAKLLCNVYPELSIYKDVLAPDRYGFVLQKDSLLTDRFNEVMARLLADGTVAKLCEKWFAPENDGQYVAEPDWPGNNGTIRACMNAYCLPMSYVRNGQPAGLEIELLYEVARELDMKLEVEMTGHESILAGIAAGKYDIGGGCISITDERKQMVDMTDSVYEGAVVLVYRDPNAEEIHESFITRIAASFERTFLREDRWKQFISGILTTLWITVASLLFGSVLGFFVYLICKDGNVISNKIAGFCIWLIEGMPMVVLLMILYYIVFGKSEISGTWVAILGFTLTFGCSVFGMVKAGVNAVDSGQMEAALAMGYGRNFAFFRMILPQAARHFIEPFKGAVVQHIKATSIVGYIAVQDLTKMSDLIRSRTYEAFFPLLATAILYFLMAAVLTFLVKRLQIRLNVKKRDSRLLKGVKR